MNKEDIKKLARDDRCITGIYNYCDRWCERCPFTARCMNFVLAEKQFSDTESRDIRNKAFWERLSETFRITLELVKDMAERQGIDLDSVDIENELEQESFDEQFARNRKFCRMAEAYADMVDDWFESGTRESEQKDDQLESKMEILTPSVDADAICVDCLAVVRWYQYQIHVKLLRAVRGELKEGYDRSDEYAKDSDGSAKVALIGIDRSIAAWGELRVCFLTYEKEILDILAHLGSLRRTVEEAFPEAREFIRPGFDRVHLIG